MEVKLSEEMRDKLSDSSGSKLDDAVGVRGWYKRLVMWLDGGQVRRWCVS